MKVITDFIINESLQDLNLLSKKVNNLNVGLSSNYAYEIASNVKFVDSEINKIDDELVKMITFTNAILDSTDRILSTFDVINSQNQYLIEQLDKIKSYANQIKNLRF